ncbi:glycosyltransferase [Tenacibaculum sp. C7A-26P2]|uniref:glycosyltransferase n=1 Tax=Tenacibaculum sp. C7A-26P2 TaxID=3447504 RepID=UPI003F83A07D
MIKILHIARPLGGIGTYIQLLNEHLDKNQFKNLILCNYKDDLSFIKDKTINNNNFSHINLRREVSPLSDIICLFSILKKVKQIQPDVIHCHSAKAGFFGRLIGAYLGISTLYTPHAFSYLSSGSVFKKLLFLLIEKSFVRFPSSILCCSESEYHRAVFDLNFKKNKVFIWRNSIKDPSLFLKLKNTSKLTENYICSIGRLSFQKNPLLLIDVFEEIKKRGKSFKLVVLGVGFYSPFLAKINKVIRDKNLINDVFLMNWTGREEVLQILKNALLYVSTSKYEGLPYSLLEALSLSKACVVTDVDGNKDLVINNFNGYKLPENAKEIAEKIIWLIENTNERKQMEYNSRKLFEKSFRIEDNIHLLQDIYKKVV